MPLAILKCFQTVRRDQSVLSTHANDTLNRACPQKSYKSSNCDFQKLYFTRINVLPVGRVSSENSTKFLVNYSYRIQQVTFIIYF